MVKGNAYNYRRIEKAMSYLADNFKLQPDLQDIASKVNLSPFHFQRMFLDWVGLTPKKFLQYLTIDFLKQKIHETQNMIDAADIAGLSAQSRVHDLFVTIEAVTPQQYKSGGALMEIYYGYHSSPFGMCFIAATEKGICRLHFLDEDRKRDEFDRFSQQWSFARIIHKPDLTQTYIERIFQKNGSQPDRLNVLVQGTNFQIKVWEAMLNIPYGHVASFQQIANRIDHPSSVRSVASAVGANPLAFLIPCHRIIAKDGTMGDFHWGKVRKKLMIGWEIVSKPEPSQEFSGIATQQ